MNQARSRANLIFLGILATTACGCAVRSTGPAGKPAAGAAHASTQPVHPGLHNVFSVAPGLINGSAPRGDEGFTSLSAMGVRTIICVDGATPDIDRATRHGMRYVHLPIGYGGISDAEALTLARAVRDLPRPIYIHCFHGKHRSPSAAAVAMVGLGTMTNEAALAMMRRAGTSEGYAGLYAAVGRARPFDTTTLGRVPAEFPSKAELPGFVHAMAALGRTWDDVKAIKAAGWTSPADHPDLTPNQAVGLLASRLRDLAQGDALAGRPAPVHAMMADAHGAATRMVEALGGEDPTLVQAAFDGLRRSCLSCHRHFRD